MENLSHAVKFKISDTTRTEWVWATKEDEESQQLGIDGQVLNATQFFNENNLVLTWTDSKCSGSVGKLSPKANIVFHFAPRNSFQHKWEQWAQEQKNLLVHQDREHDYREGKIFQDLLTLYRQNFGAACKDTINSLRNFVKLEECCPVYKETRVIHAVFASDGTQIYGILCLSLTTPIVHSICHWKVKRIHRQVVFREFRFVKVH